MSKTTKTTTNPKKPLKKYICKHCTQSKTGKEMKCLDEKYLCCLDCHAKRKKTKQPPRTYLCLGCGKEKSYAEMQYQKTEKETGKGIGKCKDCFDGKKKLKKYKCRICGEEKVWADMHYVTNRTSKCKACRNVRVRQPKVDTKPAPKLAPKLTIFPETRIVTLCQLCKTKKPIIDFDILPNCTRDTICKQCREFIKENDKAKLFKKPICMHCRLPILHESNKTGMYHKQCKDKRNAIVPNGKRC